MLACCEASKHWMKALAEEQLLIVACTNKAFKYEAARITANRTQKEEDDRKAAVPAAVAQKDFPREIKQLNHFVGKCCRNPPDGVTLVPELADPRYPREVFATIEADGRYRFGKFLIKIEVMELFPVTYPRITFQTPVFHPNVRFATGHVDPDPFGKQIQALPETFPRAPIKNSLLAVLALLREPNFDYVPLNPHAKWLHEHDLRQYVITVRIAV